MGDNSKDEIDWADRLIDRHDGDWNKAIEDASRESIRYAYSTAEGVFWRMVVAKIKEKSRIRLKKPRSKSNRSSVIEPAFSVGGECPCGGRNKSCFRCDGSGIIQPAGGTVATIGLRGGGKRVRRKGRRSASGTKTMRNKPESCPVCDKKLGVGGVAAHVRAKHPEV